jgi:hypothetical protein
MKIWRMQCLYDEELLQSAHGVAAVTSEELLGAWPQMPILLPALCAPARPTMGVTHDEFLLRNTVAGHSPLSFAHIQFGSVTRHLRANVRGAARRADA